ncbi:hypothetical protein WJX75_004389 [Coccomyxa subellipsoidea]|uniref:Uncharacterized protein n=1 Tax=Coccomyxa subellipsoidea TaxID=248742 RepID=A0ABR2YXR1_9CHLO
MLHQRLGTHAVPSWQQFQGANMQFQNFVAPSSFHQALDHRPEFSMGPFPGSLSSAHLQGQEMLPIPIRNSQLSQDPLHKLPVQRRSSSPLEEQSLGGIDRSDILQLNGNIQPPPTHDGAKVVFLVEDETQVSDEDLVNGDNALPQTPEYYTKPQPGGPGGGR